MRNKTISLSEEIYNQLANEKNASALIDELLTRHYKIAEKTPEQIINDVKTKISETDKWITWGTEFKAALLENQNISNIEDIEAYVAKCHPMIEQKWNSYKEALVRNEGTSNS